MIQDVHYPVCTASNLTETKTKNIKVKEVPYKSSAKEFSFECSQHRILSTDSKLIGKFYKFAERES